MEKQELKRIAQSENIFNFSIHDSVVTVLITGVGMVATTFQLTKHLSQHDYNLILNIGIAGAFENTLQLGEVVQVCTDCFAELGADDTNQFVSVFSLGLIAENEFPFSNRLLKNSLEAPYLKAFKKVNGITVNKVSGNQKAIEKLKAQLIASKYKPETESMEGAAFFYTCFQFNAACIQLRAISNYIENRNKANWKIKEAVSNLETAVLLVLHAIEKES